MGLIRSQKSGVGWKLKVISHGGSLVHQPGHVVGVLDVPLAPGEQLLVVADLLLGQHGGLKPLEPLELSLLYAE